MTMLAAEGPNASFITHWNAAAGATWVALRDSLDHELAPLGLAATEALAPASGERVIDIGCGCGATSLELARRVGPSGSVVGVDLSAAMLEVARDRARAAGLANARFVQADAQLHAFEAADAAFSRFGVMFFADPVAAFANIRKALAPRGRLAFVCWRAFAENAWMTVPMSAALPLLPAPPPPFDPLAPGPFAFAERTRVESVLAGAGFTDIVLTPHDQKIGWGDLDASTETALSIGPLGAIVRESPGLREGIEGAVRAALAPHATPEGVLMDSATWIVWARAG